MKQKMVIKVQMHNDRRRTRAMKIAAAADGMSSVAIQGSEKDELMVSGEGVDSVNLTRSLRRKLCYAAILSVEEVKANAGTGTSANFEQRFWVSSVLSIMSTISQVL